MIFSVKNINSQGYKTTQKWKTVAELLQTRGINVWFFIQLETHFYPLGHRLDHRLSIKSTATVIAILFYSQGFFNWDFWEALKILQNMVYEQSSDMNNINCFYLHRSVFISNLANIFPSSTLYFQHKYNKTARIRAKPWMFRVPFKVYAAVIAWKN